MSQTKNNFTESLNKLEEELKQQKKQIEKIEKKSP